ncbi:MAG: DUF1801 domain-containing protein, partial [Candidatus Thermoplasmatota archaeon]|nr:DUF1801 domain-containing protein [Candidatus Thermoplasmatota archaeon]
MDNAIKTIPGKDVDGYLSSVPEKTRNVLEKLHKTIKAAAPKAIEKISYQIPTFTYHGMLVGFAAFKSHCSFFVMSPSVMDMYKDELRPYDTVTATIRFPINKPLPVSLVKKLLKARIKEN